MSRVSTYPSGRVRSAWRPRIAPDRGHCGRRECGDLADLARGHVAAVGVEDPQRQFGVGPGRAGPRPPASTWSSGGRIVSGTASLCP